MHNFRELKIWKEAMEITKTTYQFTKQFPNHELYGLGSQINRAAVSIPSNIAEGAGRKGNNEFTQFLNIAMGSCFELETQLILAIDLGYIHKDKSETLIIHLQQLERMINGLISNLRNKSLISNI